MFLDDRPLPAGRLLEIERGKLKIVGGDPRQAGAAAMEIRVGIDDLIRHDAGLEDLLPAVDVAQEKVPCPHALCEPRLDARPFLARNDKWHQVEPAGRTRFLRRGIAGIEVVPLLFVQFLREGKNAVELLGRQQPQCLLQLEGDVARQ